jgi:hypothetical protein
MATISDVRANYGLRAVGTTTYPTGSGAVSLGIENQTVRLTDADVFYAIQALVVGSASDLVINTSTGAKTDSTAWTAGSAQVETATVVAASGATSNGNLAVVVSSTSVTGTPLTVNIPLTTAAHTTAALIAQAIVDGLNANAAVSAAFTATRSTAAVVLTRKPTGTYTVGSASVPVYLVGDASEFTIPTALGVTGATSATGAGAAAGVASAGCYVVGDGEDFEGNALGIIEFSALAAFTIYNDATGGVTISTAATMTDFPLKANSALTLVDAGLNGATETFTIEPASTALVTIIVAGKV